MSAVSSDIHFPILNGESLAHDEMRLPDDFQGELNLVFVAFLRRHQRTVDSWLKILGDLESSHPGLAIYEVPLLMRYPTFYRKWIDDGMRSGIPDPRTRSRTVTVYTNRKQFLDSVGLPDESEIFAALIEEDGRVVWSHIGGPSDDAVEALLTTLGHLRA